MAMWRGEFKHPRPRPQLPCNCPRPQTILELKIEHPTLPPMKTGLPAPPRPQTISGLKIEHPTPPLMGTGLPGPPPPPKKKIFKK